MTNKSEEQPMNTFFVRQLGGYWGSFNPTKHKLIDTERVVCAKDYSSTGSVNLVILADCKAMHNNDIRSMQEDRDITRYEDSYGIDRVRDFSLDRIKDLSAAMSHACISFSNNHLNNEYWVVAKEVKCITISTKKVEESEYRIACKLADMHDLPFYQVDLPRIGYFYSIDEYMDFVERFGNKDRSTFKYIDDAIVD